MGRPRSEFKKDQFYFWRYDPGKGALSKNDWKLEFEAHITSLSDASNPNYSEYFDMGRADPKVFYAGSSRTINLSFFVAAMNKEEHKRNYDFLLPRLGSLTYPIYETGNGYNSPHILFQIGALITGYGIITSLNYDWKPEYPWINPDSTGVKPLYTDVTLTIKLLANSRGQRPNADKQYLLENR